MQAKTITSRPIETTTSSPMDPGIWSRLPGELLERILALLPLKTLLVLRSTCKHFNSLLISPSFLSQTKAHLFSSFLLLSHPQSHPRFPLYDVFLGRWRTLALTLSLPPTFVAPHLISTSNGLLCFSLPDSFLIVNLLTRSTRTVQFPNCPFVSATLIAAHPSASSSPMSPHGFNIFILCSNSAFVYDSEADRWTRFNGFNPILSESSHHEGVAHSGSLYFTTQDPFSIVGFELATGRWDQLSAHLPPGLTFIRLASSSDRRLFLVGGVGQDGISRNLKVWELGGGGMHWDEIATLPELMCRKFGSVCYHNYERVYCLWHDGMICICCYTWAEILVYKVGRRTWHWLPKCPLLPEKSSCGFRWFSFAPDLYALV
ncbi:F-box/kelch-repeat protein At5g43190-like [Magnolia sinica]|uniref:F-box/kelch-repeat protein At5g43190-like n=1 Tax=Magnolia sinica TaxID=86752 RepID=UPI002658E1D2|nr:F-box/kelch-repeat protein At5g43190-like [Magnolia sinica]